MLLQISIPTFNRPESLRQITVQLEDLKDLCHSKKLRIIVYDNSDMEAKKENKITLPNFINYRENKVNLGFGGNVRRCLEESIGIYTWVISDDDKINPIEIRKIIAEIELSNSKITGFALPCEIPTISGMPELEIGLTKKFGEVLKFEEALSIKKMPFDYLGGLIIRTENLRNINFDKININNDYYQSMVYCLAIGKNELIKIHNKPLISWVGSRNVRWSLLKLIKSREEICGIINQNHNIKMDKSELTIEVLKWGVFARSGMYTVSNIEQDRFKLALLAINAMKIIGYVYAILLILPRNSAKTITEYLLAIKMKNNRNLRFYDRIKENIKLVKSFTDDIGAN
jgi:hypothetical protein